MRRTSLLLVLLCLCVLWLPAAAEDDGFSEEDFSIEDMLEIQAEIEEDRQWNFPVSLEEMEPKYIVLANQQYLLNKDFVPDPLVTIPNRKKNKDGSNANGGMLKASGGTMQLEAACAAALVEMAEAAREDGMNLYLKSAYRSWKTQNTMYKNRLAKHNGKDDGWVSKAGASDHQTGLGADVIPKSWIKKEGMNSKMAKEPECIWMAENCHRFGFIVRYPEDKEEVTGIHYEPWQMRYVGIPAATYIMENGLCLEEFTEQLQAAIERFLNDGGDPQLVNAYIRKPTEQ